LRGKAAKHARVLCQASQQQVHLPLEGLHSKSQQHSSFNAMSVAVTSAAAAALLLCPAQAAHALPEAQLDQIKQTIDRDFQQGQVSFCWAPRAWAQDSTSAAAAAAQLHSILLAHKTVQRLARCHRMCLLLAASKVPAAITFCLSNPGKSGLGSTGCCLLNCVEPWACHSASWACQR
jgi:hypothetical protein